jgi:excisionase family DNA binding protein
MTDARKWLTVKQAAEYFGLPRGTVYSLIGRGLLPQGSILRLGRQLRINVGAIEKGAAEGRTKLK